MKVLVANNYYHIRGGCEGVMFNNIQEMWSFPLLHRIALSITIDPVRYPGIKTREIRIILLQEVLLQGGNAVGGLTAIQIHETILTTFQLSAHTYKVNQLRYDLRKLKGHCLLERAGSRYAYRSPPKLCRSRSSFVLPQATLQPLALTGDHGACKKLAAAD
jgi:hypothetical protein